MSFMEAEVTDKMYWLAIDGNCGTEYIPQDLFSLERVKAIIDGPDDDEYAEKVLAIVQDYTDNTEAYSAELIFGYGVRSSAAGYLDCTPWSVYTNKREALAAARQEQRECEGKD